VLIYWHKRLTCGSTDVRTGHQWDLSVWSF